jgi:hypothetical protein
VGIRKTFFNLVLNMLNVIDSITIADSYYILQENNILATLYSVENTHESQGLNINIVLFSPTTYNLLKWHLNNKPLKYK